MNFLHIYCIFALQSLWIIPKEIVMFIISMIPHDKKVYCGSKYTAFIIDGDVYTRDMKNPVIRKLIFNEGMKIDSMYYGQQHKVILEKSRKTLYSWGRGDVGVLGLGDYKNWDIPQQIMFDFGSEIMCVASGFEHMMVITKFNEIYGWGYNGHGQLGLGDNVNRNFPHKLPIRNVKSVSCGRYFTIILTKGGCFGCGHNNCGELGLGNDFDRISLQKINISNPILISSGHYHTIALTIDGIYSWGGNSCGELGLGDNKDRWLPQKINFVDSSVISISCGREYTMILTTQYQLFGCGTNIMGQLGLDKDILYPSQFQKINLSEPIRSVHCGETSTIIITKSDKYYGCGNNSVGQLGMDSKLIRHVYGFKEIIIKK